MMCSETLRWASPVSAMTSSTAQGLEGDSRLTAPAPSDHYSESLGLGFKTGSYSVTQAGRELTR